MTTVVRNRRTTPEITTPRKRAVVDPGQVMTTSPTQRQAVSPRQYSPSMKMEKENHDYDDGSVNEEAQNVEPLLGGNGRVVPLGNVQEDEVVSGFFVRHFSSNPEFFQQAAKFVFCFCGLQASYLTWGYMQELIMTSKFNPTDQAPSGKFPSAAFCVFSNRFLAVIVAAIAVRIKHGSVYANNVAPLWAFTPCALSNTMSSWSQYASLKWVSFPVQTVFKSSKIIPVMMMGKLLKGTTYPYSQYVEAILITIGVAIFSIASKEPKEGKSTEIIGLLFLLMYIFFDSFTAQWQDKVYKQYGKSNVDPYQMMLGVNSSAICITTVGLIITGDFPIVYEFLLANPVVLQYNIITAITSASGQLFIFYTIKEFGPIVFTIMMTTRQMISICISAVAFRHAISPKAILGAVIVFSVIFYQIRRKYKARAQQSSLASSTSASNGGSGKEVEAVALTKNGS